MLTKHGPTSRFIHAENARHASGLFGNFTSPCVGVDERPIVYRRDGRRIRYNVDL